MDNTVATVVADPTIKQGKRSKYVINKNESATKQYKIQTIAKVRVNNLKLLKMKPQPVPLGATYRSTVSFVL